MKKLIGCVGMFAMMVAASFSFADATVSATAAPGSAGIVSILWNLLTAFVLPALLTGSAGKVMYDLLFKVASWINVPVTEIPNVMKRVFIWLTGVVLVPVWNKLSPGHAIDPSTASGAVEMFLVAVLPMIMHHAVTGPSTSPAVVTVKQ